MKKLFFICNHATFFVSHRINIAIQASKIFDVKLCLGQASSKEEDYSLNLLQKKKISFKIFNFRSSSINLITELMSFVHLFSYIFINKPDYIHLISPKAILLGGVISKLLNIKFLVISISGMGSIMNLRSTCLKKIYLTILGYILRRKKKKLIFHNNNDLNFFKKNFNLNDNECILTFGSGVNFKKIKNITKYKKKENIVTFPSRVLKDKGIIEFLKSAEYLKKKYPNWFFKVVGSLDYRSPMILGEEIVNKYTKNKIVEFTGYKKNILDIISKSKIICLPSYREGMPKVLVEASLLGKPIVTTDIPGCREIVKYFGNGILVKKKSILSLKTGLEKLMTNDFFLKKLEKKIDLKNFTKFSENFVVKKNIECYLKLQND